MTDTAVELETVEPVESAQPGQPVPVSDEQLVAMLVERARTEGLQLTGQGGLLQQLTKRVLESALEGEITDHLGYEKREAAGRSSGNSRNGGRAKTVPTDVGPVEVKVPLAPAPSTASDLPEKRLTLHQNERHERHFSVRISPVTPTPHIMCTHKTAGQEPLAAGSRMATHSTWWVIGTASNSTRSLLGWTESAGEGDWERPRWRKGAPWRPPR